jgi:AmmeMemoRadiSam system protein A
MDLDRARPLDVDERRWLLRLARSTIDARLIGGSLPETAPPAGPLCEIRGAFVTLTADGVLRGCIGHVVGAEPLWLSVRSNAVNAAFHDPRFSPVTADEISGLMVEISALTPLRPIDSPTEIEVGRHGLLIERGPARGLLLPQVAERYAWSPEEFLDQTCRKAGMGPGCWRSPEARISVFSAEVFSEEEIPDAAGVSP